MKVVSSMKYRPRGFPWRVRVWLGAAIAFVAVGLGSAPSFGAQTGNAGSAVIVGSGGDAVGGSELGSSTAFSLHLPKGASCPGDSAHGGYRVQSFMVPGAADPAILRYKSTAPAGSGLYPLFATSTRGYVQVQTANADPPDGPGVIVNIPLFSYAVFPPGTLGSGTYHIGIACTLHNETVRYWSTDVILRTTSDDTPAGFRWRPASAPTASTRSGGAVFVFVGAAVVLICAALVVLRSRMRRAADSSKESP